jgi:divalent metal cation (Fe/Co/Zn/Cd) transporter
MESMNASNNAPLPAARPSLLRKGRQLEWFTLAWNSLEAVVAAGAGWISGSPSLVGFGFDSIIENTSAVTLLWRLQDGQEHGRERRALRVVGVSFLMLAAYVVWEAARDLLLRDAPEVSYVGIAIAALSLVVMPLLARSKRRLAAQLTSRALQADSRQTSLCAYLSAILLGGLVLNALLGWWWADPLAALVMAPIIVREGVGALRGEHCDDCC